jgi:hypothetical protein
MTLILGIERDGAPALVCYDSGMWQGEIATTLRTPKVWRSNGWVIGAAGNWGACQALREVAAPGRPQSEDFDDCTTTAYRFSRQLLEAYADFADVLKRTDEMKPESPQVLAAYGSWVWDLTNGEAVATTLGFACAGLTAQAIGAWVALEYYECGDPMGRARNTFASIANVSHYIAPPFRWMATDGTEGEL